MYKIIIIDQDGHVLEEYENPGTYVAEAEIEENMIKLICVKAVEGGYAYTTNQHIMNNAQIENKKNQITQITTQIKEEQTQIVLNNSFSAEKKITLVEPKEIANIDSHILELKSSSGGTEMYYVFAEGKLQEMYSQANEAVIRANELMGVVVSDKQDYIWERGGRKIRTQISDITQIASTAENSIVACLDGILLKEGKNVSASAMLEKGEMAVTLLKSNIEGKVFDLTGVPLNAVLYYVSKGTPVLALNNEGQYVLIVGYDELNITVMNPVRGTTYKIGMNDSTDMFDSAGNIFIGYLK